MMIFISCNRIATNFLQLALERSPWFWPLVLKKCVFWGLKSYMLFTQANLLPTQSQKRTRRRIRYIYMKIHDRLWTHKRHRPKDEFEVSFIIHFKSCFSRKLGCWFGIAALCVISCCTESCYSGSLIYGFVISFQLVTHKRLTTVKTNAKLLV